MFKKILVVEDIDTINLGIKTVLESTLDAPDVRVTKYCDEAILKVKKAQLDNAPFELIITDLSFKEDHRTAQLRSGEDLICAIRKEQPDVPIIIYSIENRPYRIKSLFENFSICAYVEKSRESCTELMDAINICSIDANTYISPQLAHILKEPVLFEIDDHDVELMRYLAEGYTQNEISEMFKAGGKVSSSMSSIEKRINKLKIYFQANNTIHLISVAKDFGII
ncbi:MAG: response regulator transcription factor [Cytophagaceae bacterium]|nr:MAG: response regulator transcription factor [Cytophagaceae bacterium]